MADIGFARVPALWAVSSTRDGIGTLDEGRIEIREVGTHPLEQGCGFSQYLRLQHLRHTRRMPIGGDTISHRFIVDIYSGAWGGIHELPSQTPVQGRPPKRGAL